jgi:hypothetical protein
MSDSSLDQDLFGNDEPRPASPQGRQHDLCPPYANTLEFRAFAKEHSVHLSRQNGYIAAFLYRPHYFSGQTVRGYAIMDLFKNTDARELILKVKGVEKPGKYGKEIHAKLAKEPEEFQAKNRKLLDDTKQSIVHMNKSEIVDRHQSNLEKETILDEKRMSLKQNARKSMITKVVSGYQGSKN